MLFTVRYPISEYPAPRSEAAVVSRHGSLSSAREALLRHQIETEKHGSCSNAFIWDDEHNCLVPYEDQYSKDRE